MKTSIRTRAKMGASRIAEAVPLMTLKERETVADLIELMLRRERAIMARKRLIRRAVYEAILDAERGPDETLDRMCAVGTGDADDPMRAVLVEGSR